jgi:DNA polymerase-3 subunit delta'
LKTLEEPPSSTLFILICSDPQKLLTTIISRTQRINVGTVDEEDLAPFLTEKTGIEMEKAQQLAITCEGNISWALDKAVNENMSATTWFAEWMRAVYSKNLIKISLLADQFDAFSKEDQKSVLEHTLHIFRQCLYQISGTSQLIKSLEKERGFIENFSKTLTGEAIGKMSEKVSEVHYHLERNARAKMLHLDLSLQLIRIFHAKN